MTPELSSERVVISSPMSVAGAVHRSLRIGQHRTAIENRWARLAAESALWLLAASVMLIWVIAAVLWTLVMLLVFSWLFVGWRVFRRGNRNRKAIKLRHRETLDAIGHGGRGSEPATRFDPRTGERLLPPGE